MHNRREGLPLIELGAVTLEALPYRIFDVSREGGGWPAVALEEDDGRSGLLGHALPDLDDGPALWNACRRL
jgi:hypothetical protein